MLSVYVCVCIYLINLPISVQCDSGVCKKSKHKANSSPLVTVQTQKTGFFLVICIYTRRYN